MRRLSAYLFTLLILVVFSNCRQEPINQEPSTLFVRLNKDPEKLNPVLYPITQARPVSQHIFLPLAEYDSKTFEYEPILIKAVPEWRPEGEGVAFDMEILADAVWPDGIPITGYDVAFTIKMVNHPQSAAAGLRTYLGNISNVTVDADNDKKFSIYFKENYALARDAATNFEILPEHIYDKRLVLRKYNLSTLQEMGESVVSQDSILNNYITELNSITYARDVVVGAGPYQLRQWLSDEAVVLEKVPNYWGVNHENELLSQGPQTIVYKIIPDETKAIAELRSGLVDLVPDISSNTYQLLQDSISKGVAVDGQFVMRYIFLLLNNDHPILSDKTSRIALSMCTDVNKYIELLNDGHAAKTTSFINPLKPQYNKDIKAIEFSPDQAKSLLMNNGWTDSNGNGILDKSINGKTQDFIIDYYASGKLGTNIGTMLKEDANKAGIEINIIQKDFSITKKENLATGNFGAIASLAGQSLGPDDPYLRFHSDNAVPGGTNEARYRNPEVDQWIDQLKDVDDKVNLAKAYNEIQRIIYEDQAIIYLYVPKSLYAFDENWDIDFTAKRPGFHLNTAKLSVNK